MRLSVITDEIAPDLDTALRECEALGLSAVELRSVGGRNVVHHEQSRLREFRDALAAGGFACPVVDTPFLKATKAIWEHLDRGMEIADLVGATAIRVFSGLRVDDRDWYLPWLADVLSAASNQVRAAGFTLLLEIDEACMVATVAEADELLGKMAPGLLGVVWDPANEARFRRTEPDTVNCGKVAEAVAHVHVKDYAHDQGWVKPGAGIVGWPSQLRGLADAGYDEYLSIETHYSAPVGGTAQATRDSVASLRLIAAESGVSLL
ncbi:sugar phosphate isomerase/epimerase family protein [Kutzneria sp. NPDC051319]|uniref:sugar phosphate isomerase/epimerase family protein n=1 Tax=Kutzneria sp. NPDC051319 TaxID=3155047 RepID=UPI00343C63D9